MISRYHFERTLGLAALLAAAIVILCLYGCATFGGGEMTIDQKAALLRAGTLTATSIGLGRIDDDTQRVEIAARIVLIADEVVNVLDNVDLPLTGEQAIDLLEGITPPADLAHIPPEARAAVIAAIDILLSQVDIPDVSDILPKYTVTLLRAAIDGIRAGARVHVTRSVSFLTRGGRIIVINPAPEEI